MTVSKRELFTRFVRLEDKFTSKNINLQVNSNDIDNVLNCFFSKTDYEYNSWVESEIERFFVY